MTHSVHLKSMCKALAPTAIAAGDWTYTRSVIIIIIIITLYHLHHLFAELTVRTLITNDIVILLSRFQCVTDLNMCVELQIVYSPSHSLHSSSRFKNVGVDWIHYIFPHCWLPYGFVQHRYGPQTRMHLSPGPLLHWRICLNLKEATGSLQPYAISWAAYLSIHMKTVTYIFKTSSDGGISISCFSSAFFFRSLYGLSAAPFQFRTTSETTILVKHLNYLELAIGPSQSLYAHSTTKTQKINGQRGNRGNMIHSVGTAAYRTYLWLLLITETLGLHLRRAWMSTRFYAVLCMQKPLSWADFASRRDTKCLNTALYVNRFEGPNHERDEKII
jgi:hypothetical protein